MSDGSLVLQVRSLGASTPKATQKLSSLFNRKVGYIHLCMVLGLCPVQEDVTFHCQRLELFNGEDFNKDYVGVAGKKLLRQTLQEGQDLAMPPEEVIDEGELEPPEVPPASPTKATEDPTVPTGKGRGVSEGQDLAPGGQQLRDRLEKLKMRELRKMGLAAAPEIPLEPTGGDLGQRLINPRPVLHSGRRLINPTEELESMMAQAQQAAARGDQGQREPTMPSWMTSSTSKKIGNQLALRAAATNQGGRPPGPSGSGGGQGPPRKKKKKKGKKKKKKKDSKKKKRKKLLGGPPGGGGGNSGGSSSSESSTSDSSSEEEESRSSESEFLPPLKRKSENRPGSVLELLLNQIEANLAELQGSDSHSSILASSGARKLSPTITSCWEAMAWSQAAGTAGNSTW